MGKRLGQHFLRDKNVLEKIVNSGKLTSSDLVIEIGPGHGVLTEKLTEKAKLVYAIEKDEHLFLELQNNPRRPKNLNLIEGDALDPKIWAKISDENKKNKNQIKIIANIPYEITSPLLFLLFDSPLNLQNITLLIQKEVAERITAQPKTKQRSILSIFCQLFAEVEIKGIVGPKSFYPPPKVDSAIIRLTPKAKDHPDQILLQNRQFRALVKLGFGHRRKQLKNNLVSLGKTPLQITDIFTKINLKPLSRAEELSLLDWQNLFIHLG